MLRFGILGAGRVGRRHARNLASMPEAHLLYIYDRHEPAASATAEQTGATVARDPDEILNDSRVDAVLIASSTPTHSALIERSARAGKAVFCEKPIDLDIDRVEECARSIGHARNRVQIGFNRRFDRHHLSIRQAILSGGLGRLEKLIITSRDPEPPSLDYLQVSGGLFRDMMTHDLDLARFLSTEEPVEVSAMGSVLISEEIRSFGDVDTAMVVMRLGSGALCHINCSRRAVYGRDQRVEAFGSVGMFIENNETAARMDRNTRIAAQGPLTYLSVDRRAESYVAEIRAFVNAVEKGEPPSPGFEDGRRALILANAALRSHQTGRVETVDYSRTVRKLPPEPRQGKQADCADCVQEVRRDLDR